MKMWDSRNKVIVEHSKSQAGLLERVANAAEKPVAIDSRPPEPKPEAVEVCAEPYRGPPRSTGGLRWINAPKPTAPTGADSLAQKKTAEEKASREKERSESRRLVREASDVYFGNKPGNRDAAASVLRILGWYIP